MVAFFVMFRNISFIIPVYNRPEELDELLQSMTLLYGDMPFEVVVVEDGSQRDSKEVIHRYSNQLQISYFFKPNTGPGDSRNYGMTYAKGDYFIILDSDCVLPSSYLKAVKDGLQRRFTHCFGGPDAAHMSFSPLQKAINYSMTSVFTTGGIRGNKKAVQPFEPRSFNMGLSQEAFVKSGGFGLIHPGEDPDLSIRLRKLGFETQLIPEAFVYHKRRISWKSFRRQMYKFGLARPVLQRWHPETNALFYWFPTLFCFGLILGIGAIFWGFPWLLFVYLTYFAAIGLHSWRLNRSFRIAILSVWAVVLQFGSYGRGYLRSVYLIFWRGLPPEKALPELFFRR